MQLIEIIHMSSTYSLHVACNIDEQSSGIPKSA